MIDKEMEKLKGFTLIELLVVIAIIALLLSIIIPAVNLAKKKAAAAVCLVNVKNLSLGWYMYQEDNDGNLMNANMAQEYSWIKTPCDEIGTILSYNQSDPVTDEDEIRGMKLGVLWPYVKAPDSYNCPSDKVKSKYDGTEKLITYAIARALNGTVMTLDDYIIKKFGVITSPSMRYVFVETAETRNYNMGGQFPMATPEFDGRWGWWGPMAVSHGDSSTLGFCDGHAENRKWRDSYTKARVEKLILQNVDLYGREYPGDLPEFPIDMVTDVNYMAKGWPCQHFR